jgi:hypothetical protein
MLAIRLPDTIEERLNTLAAETGRTKTALAREAIGSTALAIGASFVTFRIVALWSASCASAIGARFIDRTLPQFLSPVLEPLGRFASTSLQ